MKKDWFDVNNKLKTYEKTLWSRTYVIAENAFKLYNDNGCNEAAAEKASGYVREECNKLYEEFDGCPVVVNFILAAMKLIDFRISEMSVTGREKSWNIDILDQFYSYKQAQKLSTKPTITVKPL